MKTAKTHLDNLVQRVRDGKEPIFGETERVFAQAFLRRFIEEVGSERFVERAQAFYKEHLVEDDEDDYDRGYDEEEPELSDEQLLHYQLEQVRIAEGVLGVRASVNDLSMEISTAVGRRNWDLLEKVLSLTEERELDESRAKRIALSELKYFDLDSYQEINERFGPFSFTAEEIESVYERGIISVDLKGVEQVQEETGIEVPDRLWQKAYETLTRQLNPKINENHPANQENKHTTDPVSGRTVGVDEFIEGKIAKIKEIYEFSGVKPQLSREIVRDLQRAFLSTDEESIFKKIEGIFDIYSDRRLSLPLQYTALKNEYVPDFVALYQKCEHKLPARKILQQYDRWERERNFGSIHKVTAETGVIPSEDTLNKMYNYLLDGGRTDGILDLFEKTQHSPNFDEQRVTNCLQNRGYALGYASEVFRVLRLLNQDINPTHVQEVAVRNMSRVPQDSVNYLINCQKLERFCQDYDVPIPDQLRSALGGEE